eukprot:10023947-Heterocapsa_arctica.AAC.1
MDTILENTSCLEPSSNSTGTTCTGRCGPPSMFSSLWLLASFIPLCLRDRFLVIENCCFWLVRQSVSQPIGQSFNLESGSQSFRVRPFSESVSVSQLICQ